MGIIEMAIAASWTRVVTRAHVAATGAVTAVNIFIWYFVIRLVFARLDDWKAVIPYAAGCALGSMLAVTDVPGAIKRMKRKLAPKAELEAAGSGVNQESAML